jgi:hypothetical protein
MRELHTNSVGKAFQARLLILLIGTLVIILIFQGFIAAQSIANAATAPTLGTAANFALLAGSTVTNTGPTVIKGGNLGVSPGIAVTGFPPGVITPPGTIQAGNAIALQGQNDVTTAYNNLAGQPCNTNLTGQDLGGKTLTAGVYCFPGTSAQLTGALTFNAAGDPNAVFIIQIGSSLTTASSSVVQMIGSANPCNVFWQIGSSATFGTSTSFVGNILALTSITLTTDATLSGRALARNGAVTLDSNIITAPACLAVTPTPPTASATPPATATAGPIPTATGRPSGPTPTPVPVPTTPPVVVATLTPAPTSTTTPVPGTPGDTTPTPGTVTQPGSPVTATPAPGTTPGPGQPSGPGRPPLPNTGPDSQASETFLETGFSLNGMLLGFWNNNGGLSIFGFPIDSERENNGLVFQWFERNRLELHPENAAPYNILLGRLGSEALANQGIDWTTLPKVSYAPAGCLYFPETEHSLCGNFLTYWQNNGLTFEGTSGNTFAQSLALFGLPLSQPRMETNSSGDRVITQWFERARFEYHPDKPSEYRVLLGRLGAELTMYTPSQK